MVEEKLGQLEDIAIETIQNETQREKRILKRTSVSHWITSSSM